MYKQGDWIIDKLYGKIGVVSNVFFDGVTAKFGGMTVLRANCNIEFAPLDIRQEDLSFMIDLALMTNDKEWFMELTNKLESVAV